MSFRLLLAAVNLLLHVAIFAQGKEVTIEFKEGIEINVPERPSPPERTEKPGNPGGGSAQSRDQVHPTPSPTPTPNAPTPPVAVSPITQSYLQQMKFDQNSITAIKALIGVNEVINLLTGDFREQAASIGLGIYNKDWEDAGNALKDLSELSKTMIERRTVEATLELDREIHERVSRKEDVSGLRKEIEFWDRLQRTVNKIMLVKMPLDSLTIARLIEPVRHTNEIEEDGFIKVNPEFRIDYSESKKFYVYVVLKYSRDSTFSNSPDNGITHYYRTSHEFKSFTKQYDSSSLTVSIPMWSLDIESNTRYWGITTVQVSQYPDMLGESNEVNLNFRYVPDDSFGTP
jgi:hypothetical protein